MMKLDVEQAHKSIWRQAHQLQAGRPQTGAKIRLRRRQLECKFSKLALKFRFIMNLFGLLTDVTLLFEPNARHRQPEHHCSLLLRSQRRTKGAQVPRAGSSREPLTNEIGKSCHHGSIGWWWCCWRRRFPPGSLGWPGSALRLSEKFLSMCLILAANCTAVYVVSAHFIWELKMLDEKITAVGQAGTGGSGWYVFKEFLENLRRHLSRLFSLALMLTWHFGCHRMELLFVECRRYYALVHIWRKEMRANEPDRPLVGRARRQARAFRGWPPIDEDDDDEAENSDEQHSSDYDEGCEKNVCGHKMNPAPEQAALGRREDEDEKNARPVESAFYALAARRIHLALWLPVAHFVFNVASLSILPASDARKPFATQWRDTPAPNSPPDGPPNATWAETLLQRAQENFASFHLQIHTVFHPYDHHLSGGAAAPLNSTYTIDSNRSALYCLGELAVYSLYFQGPRIACATCLSLVLYIHRQCLEVFNERLLAYIRRRRERPLAGEDVCALVRQYDLIGLMHGKIERAFMWSIAQWYSLMFISCLMHIFAFTESTSVFVATTSLGVTGSPGLSSGQTSGTANQQVANSGSHVILSSGAAASSLTMLVVRLASVLFVCYSPYLIYCEAFKIEAASNRAEQAIMRLARRPSDPLAQAIEPSLFEPIYLSVGDYFHISKRSMSCFLGAIVTFSVMFIAARRAAGEQAAQSGDKNERANEIELDSWRARREDSFPSSGLESGGEGEAGSGAPNERQADGDERRRQADKNKEEDEARNENDTANDYGDEPEPEPSEDERELDPERERELGGDGDGDGEKNGDEETSAAELADSADSGKEPELAYGHYQQSRPEPGGAREPEEAAEREEKGHEVGEEAFGGLHRRSQVPLAAASSPAQPQTAEPAGSGPGGALREPDAGASLAPPGSTQAAGKVKAAQWRKYRRLARQRLKLMEQQRRQHFKARLFNESSSGRKIWEKLAKKSQLAVARAPQLHGHYLGRVRENERPVELVPKLRSLNQAELCDLQLLPWTPDDRNTNERQLLGARKFGAEEKLSEEKDDDDNIDNVASSEEKSEGFRADSGRAKPQEEELDFVVSWINRVSGEASLEARRQELMNCERRRNYTFKMRAIGCNGLHSNEALVSVTVDDVNEFSPEFERPLYSVSLALDPEEQEATEAAYFAPLPSESPLEPSPNRSSNSNSAPAPLLLASLRARDQDCSAHFGSVCRYELMAAKAGGGQASDGHHSLDPPGGLQVDTDGRIWMHRLPLAWRQRLMEMRPSKGGQAKDSRQVKGQDEEDDEAEEARVSFQAIAYDCAGKKSQAPATVEVKLSKLCKPALKDMDKRVNYRPAGGQVAPFLRARLDLCGAKCHRANISVTLELSTGVRPASDLQERQGRRPRAFHCDREPYSMVSKRRLCGTRTRALELLPAAGAHGLHAKWIWPLLAEHDPSHPRAGQAGSGSPESSRERDGSLAPDLEPRDAQVEAGPEAEVGAYSAEGRYAELARLASSSPAAGAGAARDGGNSNSLPGAGEVEQQQEPLGAARAGALAPAAASWRSRRRHQHSHGHHHQHHYHSPAGRRLRARETKAPGGAAAAANLHRDQVYLLDGTSKFALVPSQVYLGANQSHWRPFLFGPKHTVTFWMRHSPFRFPNWEQQRREKQEQGNGTASSRASSELDELRRHVKEHLLCSSAAAGAAHRHHYYALFVRNCRLTLLMRRQASQEELLMLAERQQNHSAGQEQATKLYRPSEWRWSVPDNKVCDGQWHLYTLNVNYPQVELYVDGQQLEESYESLAVVDDLPLHSMARPAHFVQPDRLEQDGGSVLALGACWDAAKRSAAGHFRGALAGLSVSVGANEDSRAIECLGRCSESLVFLPRGAQLDTAQMAAGVQSDQEQVERPAQVSLADASTGERQPRRQAPLDNSLVAYQESPGRILLQGHDVADVEEALTQIAYTNARQMPSLARRTIHLATSVECHQLMAGQGVNQSTGEKQWRSQASFSLPIDPVQVQVNVLPARSLPSISITGATNVAREYAPYLEGVHLFGTLKVRVRRLPIPGEPGDQSSNFNSRSRPPAVEKNEEANYSPDSLDYIEDSSLIPEKNPAAERQWLNFNESAAPSGGGAANQIVELSSIKRRIEACSILIEPPLNQHYESLLLPLDLIDQSQLYWRQSNEAVSIYGLDSADTYQRLLAAIVYKNTRPARYLERSFRLACSDMNGRVVSNEYVQTLKMVHLKSEDDSDLGDAGEDEAAREVVIGNTTTSISNAHEPVVSLGGDQRPAMLRNSEAPQVILEPPGQMRQHTPEEPRAGGASLPSSGVGGHLPLSLLSYEPGTPGFTGVVTSTKLDRVALAFLVFIVSLIVIMLVIALTNFKEPSLSEAPASESDNELCPRQRARKSCRRLSKRRRFFPSTYTDDGHCYLDEVYEDEFDENEEQVEEVYAAEDDMMGEEDEDEEETITDTELVEAENVSVGARSHHHYHHPRALPKGAWCGRGHKGPGGRGCAGSSARCLSPVSLVAPSDLESLAWDEEALEPGAMTLVINPLHQKAGRRRARSKRRRHSGDYTEAPVFRTLVTEQRPDKRGSMRGSVAKSHLSHQEDPLLLAYGDEQVAEGQVNSFEGRDSTLLAMDEEIYTSSSSSSGSGDESGTGSASSCCSSSADEMDELELNSTAQVRGRGGALSYGRAAHGHPHHHHHHLHHHHHHDQPNGGRHLLTCPTHARRRQMDEEEGPGEHWADEDGSLAVDESEVDSGQYELYHEHHEQHHFHHVCLKRAEQGLELEEQDEERAHSAHLVQNQAAEAIGEPHLLSGGESEGNFRRPPCTSDTRPSHSTSREDFQQEKGEQPPLHTLRRRHHLSASPMVTHCHHTTAAANACRPTDQRQRAKLGNQSASSV